MKANRTTKSLDEACTFINGLWKGEKAPLKEVGVIRNTNFTKEGTLDDSDIAFIEVEAKKFEKRKLIAGDIILEKSGGGPKQPVGRVVLFNKDEGDYSFSNFTAAIRVKATAELAPTYLHKFLYWTYLSGVTEGMQSNSTGIRNLDGDKYKAIQINYPNIEEQHRIVTLLDEAFADIATAKANVEKNLQNARDLLESHLQAAFTKQADWELKTFGELAEFRNGINFNKSSKGNEIKIVGVRDFQKNFWAPLDDLETIIPDGDIPASDLIESGDLLFVRSNGNPELIGRSLLVGDLHERITHSGFTIKARLRDTELSPIYLCHFLKSGLLRREMIEGGNGANIKSLNQGTLSRLKIAFPDKSKQLLIVEHLETVQAEIAELESIYRQKLTALDDLKKSLLHQAFSGQL